MLFISLIKFNDRIKKSDVEEMDRMFENQERAGIRNLALYWTLGRIDAIRIFEAPDETTVMRLLARNPGSITTETLVAVSKDEAIDLIT